MHPRRLALAAAVAAATLMTGSAATAEAGVLAASVSITNFQFSPTPLKVNIGDLVVWNNNADHMHTSTSDQSFWDSGHINPGSNFSRAFTTAGAYHYHCAIHTEMHGVVKVRMQLTAATHGWKVRWAQTGTTGLTFDVRVKRGHHAWHSFRTDTAHLRAHFNPSKHGRYRLEARTVDGSQHSGWSPVLKVRIH